MRNIYLIAAVLGFIIPYAFFVPFITENGLNVQLFLEQAFQNKVASMLTADMLISSAVFWTFAWIQDRKRLWIYIAGTLGIGLSFALPLFLYFREEKTQLVTTSPSLQQY